MGSITGYKADRLQIIENTTIVSGSVTDTGNLVLQTREGAQIDAGYVRGATGAIGPDRPLIAGMVSIFTGSTPPSGWMFCDGAAVSRTTYSELYAAIGTAYGSGDGSTTFNLPDLKGRTPVGLDVTQTEFNTLGGKGGEKAHVLTIPEMPAHTHTVLGFKGVDDLNFSGNTGRLQASDYLTPYDQNTSSTGGGAAHNNLQPYNTVNFVISIGNVGTAAAAAEDYVGRGTTAERDTIFGVPGTDATRVALANRRIVWFNTDLGWEESYFATTGKSGLVVTGLVANASSGWYPTGASATTPAMLWEAQSQVTPAASSFIAGWGWIRKRGGASWWDSDAGGSKVKVLKHGRYSARGWTTQATGSGTSNWHLRQTTTDGTTVVRNVDGNAFPQHPSLYTRVHMEVDDIIIEPGQFIGMFTTNGGILSHVGSQVMGQFSLRYLGPPLVME